MVEKTQQEVEKTTMNARMKRLDDTLRLAEVEVIYHPTASIRDLVAVVRAMLVEVGALQVERERSPKIKRESVPPCDDSIINDLVAMIERWRASEQESVDTIAQSHDRRMWSMGAVTAYSDVIREIGRRLAVQKEESARDAK